MVAESLNRTETYKNSKISTSHRDFKTRRIAAPGMIYMVFLNWRNFINNEDI